MLGSILLILAPVAAKAPASKPCLPTTSADSDATASAIEDHRTLRGALGEQMPEGANMIFLFGKGLHLSVTEYSIAVVRDPSGVWRGTAVGRRKIAVEDAPWSVMKRADWLLDAVTGRQLDQAIKRQCQPSKENAGRIANSAPPPVDFIPERIDVVISGRKPFTLYAESNPEFAALIRPPS